MDAQTLGARGGERSVTVTAAIRPLCGRLLSAAASRLVWMQYMADRMCLAPDQRPTRRWMLRFAAAIMASLALWALFLWVLVPLLDWTGPL